MTERRFPILGKGELLASDIKGPGGFGPKAEIRTFEEAQARLIPQLNLVLEATESLSADMRLKDVYFKVALDHKYLAKSYFPATLEKSDWEFVGSRAWYQSNRDKTKFKKSQLARLLFYSASPDSVKQTFVRLERNRLEEGERNDFKKIDSVGLQVADERLYNLERFKEGLIELILHPIKQELWSECEAKLRAFSQRKHVNFLWEWKRGEYPEPVFLPARTNQRGIKALVEFNPLRAARPMPSISLPDVEPKVRRTWSGIETAPVDDIDYPYIGIIDGGTDETISQLQGWISSVDVTTEAPNTRFLRHGTAVCSAALFGNLHPSKKVNPPELKIRSFRVFPVPDEIGFYAVVDWIRDIVKSNSDIKVYNLSFGPPENIFDEEINRLTVELDRLSHNYGVIFNIAVGNDGAEKPPLDRIQPPSDLVNGLGIGAYTFDDNLNKIPAPYCSRGPGRSGSRIKPDISAFGGCDKHNFYTFLPGSDSQIRGLNGGTSLAAPIMTSIVGNLIHRSPDPSIITPQTAKALIIHNARPYPHLDRNQYGWGTLIEESAEGLLECNQNEVTVVYNGQIDTTKWVRLPLPFPDDLGHRGFVDFSFTLVFSCQVNMATPDEYTFATIEPTFRPNSEKYEYYGPRDENDKRPSRRIDKRISAAEGKRLESAGWSPSSVPCSCTYETEQQRRDKGKWDTVLSGQKTMRRDSIFRPTLDLHAVPRGAWQGRPITMGYACVVTIRVRNTQVQLYQQVRDLLPQLVEIRLRARVRDRQIV
ncbi:MAG: S8 family peptidase [Desulfomonilaceae bacterium]